jgi:tight adherence protein B
MASGPLLFAFLLALGVLLIFVGIWASSNRPDPMDVRLGRYGAGDNTVIDQETGTRRQSWTGVNRLLNGFGLGPKLAAALSHAGSSLTAAEFALVCAGCALLGFLIGSWRLGILLGLILGGLLGYAPVLYLNSLQNRRKRLLTEQLPEALTLLTGGLKAGYGLTQALQILAERLPKPSSEEFSRVMRAVSLGIPVERALNEMADRSGSDDVSLVVTAIGAQHEMGGELAGTLETIGETVRDRIRIKREIRVLTSQQRVTGFVLGAVPIVLGCALFVINPGYMRHLFEPGIARVMVIGAAVLEIIGFLIIRRILDIEV